MSRWCLLYISLLFSAKQTAGTFQAKCVYVTSSPPPPPAVRLVRNTRLGGFRARNKLSVKNDAEKIQPLMQKTARSNRRRQVPVAKKKYKGAIEILQKGYSSSRKNDAFEMTQNSSSIRLERGL